MVLGDKLLGATMAIWAVNNNNFEDYIDKYYLFWQRLIPNKQIKKSFTIWDEVKDVWTRDIFHDVFKNPAHKSMEGGFINHSLYFEAKTFLHGLLIVRINSLWHIVWKVVFVLDNDLVDFATVARHLKLNDLSEVIRINENEPGNKINQYFQKQKMGKKSCGM